MTLHHYTCSIWRKTASGWQCHRVTVAADSVDEAQAKAAVELGCTAEEVIARYQYTFSRQMTEA